MVYAASAWGSLVKVVVFEWGFGRSPCRAWLQILPQSYMHDGPIDFHRLHRPYRCSANIVLAAQQARRPQSPWLYNDCPLDQTLKQTMPRPAAEEAVEPFSSNVFLILTRLTGPKFARGEGAIAACHFVERIRPRSMHQCFRCTARWVI